MYLAIFATIALISTPCHAGVHKCCVTNELLTKIHLYDNTTVYKCIDKKHSEQDVSPLRIYDKKYDIGIPKDCGGAKACVDKTVTGEVLELRCERVVSDFSYPVKKVNKCCPLGMKYRVEKRSCEVDFQSGLQNLHVSGLFDINFGAPECPDVIFDVRTNGSLVIKQDIVEIPNGQNVSLRASCVDDAVDGAVVRICGPKSGCESGICIRKCCPVGKSYLGTLRKTLCVQTWEEPYRPERFLSPEDKLGWPGIVTGLKCRRFVGYGNRTRLLSTGNLYYNGYNYTSSEKGLQYCLENFFIEPGAERKFPQVQHNGSLLPILCIPDVPVEELKYSMFYFVILVISCVFLLLTLLTYIFLPHLKNTHGKIVMSHVSCMLVGFILLSVLKYQDPKYDKVFCYVLGYSLNFALIATFSWLNAMCFDIWYTFGSLKARLKTNGKDKMFILYCLYAFGTPTVLTSIMIAVNHLKSIPFPYRPLIGTYSCFYNNNHTPKAKFVFLILPMAVQIVSNIIFFSLTVKYCLKVKMTIRKMSDAQQKTAFLADKKTLMTILKLSLVTGISWIAEIISTYVATDSRYWLICDFLDVSQGFWIFVIFVCKPKVWRNIKDKLGFESGTAMSRSSVTASTIVKSGTSGSSK